MIDLVFGGNAVLLLLPNGDTNQMLVPHPEHYLWCGSFCGLLRNDDLGLTDPL